MVLCNENSRGYGPLSLPSESAPLSPTGSWGSGVALRVWSESNRPLARGYTAG